MSTIFPEGYYSIATAAEKIGCNYRKLYSYDDKGLIKCKHFEGNGKVYRGISADEIKRIKKLMFGDGNGSSLKEIANKLGKSTISISAKVRKLNLKPINELGNNLYSPKDVDKIVKAFRPKPAVRKKAKDAKKDSRPKFLIEINSAPTIDRLYDPNKGDVYYNQLHFYLKTPSGFSTRNVFNWAKARLVDFSLDAKDNLFFTKEQVEAIQKRYRVLPDDVVCNQKELAEQLGMSTENMAYIVRRHHIKGYKTLGYRDVFYNQSQVDLVTKIWEEEKRFREEKTPSFQLAPLPKGYATTSQEIGDKYGLTPAYMYTVRKQANVEGKNLEGVKSLAFTQEETDKLEDYITNTLKLAPKSADDVDKDAYVITSQEIADKYGIDSNTMYVWRKRINVEGRHIPGEKSLYLTQAEADKLEKFISDKLAKQ